jgi:hypothetical protein
MTKAEKIKQLISLVEVAIDKCDVVLDGLAEVKRDLSAI